jgi:transcription-repair coupling factor (superfamily II helicase)
MAARTEAPRANARDAAFDVLREALAASPALRRARRSRTRSTLGGASGSGAALAAGLLAEGRGRALIVAPSAESAEALLLDLGALFPQRPVALLPIEETGLPDGPELRANRSERLVALASLQEPGDGLLVVPGPVLLDELPEPEGEPLVLRRGGPLDREAAAARLAEAGLQRVPLIAAPGEFSLRGAILDIYPWAAAAPLRVELLDETIEDLRRFEVESQRSVQELDEISLPLGGAPGTGRLARLAERLPADTTVIVLDPPKLKDRLAEVAFEHGRAPREIASALAALAARPGADLHPLGGDEPDSDLALSSVGGGGRPEAEVLGAWLAQGRTIVLLSDTTAESERLAERLAADGLRDDRLRLVEGRLAAGFAFPGDGPVLVHHHELIGRRAVRRSRPRREVASRALSSLAELQAGDYVVHLTHGVARYLGMERLAREQGEEDFLLLEFANETRLYVPASRIDLVERFVGAGAAGPRLDKLGGKTWSSRKARVARAVEDLASELLALQAKRSGGEGFAFPPEDSLQRRFEQAFPFEDTPDQASAWRTIRADMERPRPMDRLLVGDVGFGKTEVAVRAAFKAVAAGKQVAVLVPTTILAEQHFDTFSRRMAEEAVRLEVLSRFHTGKKQEKVLADLAAGRVDIVIGTHRLLGNDVKFPDLGLVIVDEEQRFGVAHKEKLKQLRTTVDVLTLSATPIPRTLHMALSGLRDIAAIDTPPPGRRPVLTRVVRDEDGVLRRALLHEVERGGQVFVLHNRVQSIHGVEHRVRQLVPTARAAVAHGQMPPHELQETVERFAQGEVDVLVCTAIIESGIDIPRANTIIVTDPQNFGLADLHQLRGRVGREGTQAYAFFLVPEGKLAGDSERRLKAIEEYTSLGSGLPIALRDLELRGAGNLLGGEQSGHILSVGYDMYCRLLRAAVAQAKGARPEEEPGEIEVELGLTAFLPADYVPDEGVRMSLLRRLAAAGRQRLDQLEAELEDRFGRLPPAAKELLDLFRLRRLVRLAGLTSLLADGFGGVVLTVGDEDKWEARGPFERGELMPVAPGRWRANFPRHVARPSDRLGWLLQRFAKSAARER